MNFIRNAWYVVAWDYDVLPDTIFERKILGESVVVYRKSDGQPVALANRCCHRWAPLSEGRKEGDSIRCMYHGMKFDDQGICVEIPGQDRIPAKARVKSYPVLQRTRWIWIWMGDPAKADPALIPNTFSLQHPEWRMKPGYKKFNAHIQLITDNLLDFSHLSYVHEKSLGGSTAIAQARAEVTMLERGIRVVRKIRDTVPAPYHQKVGKFQGKVNRWFDYTLSVSGMFIMDSGVQSVDKAEGDFSGALRFHSCQALTPETERSTHYFFMQAHNFALDDATVTESIYQSVANAFEEDLRMIEAQQRVLDTDPGAEMLAIAADGALLQYRRLVQGTIEAEARV